MAKLTLAGVDVLRTRFADDTACDAALAAFADTAALRTPLRELVEAQHRYLQAEFEVAQVADVLRRDQKYAPAGRPSVHIVQLRKQQAAMTTAELDLGYTDIKAPIAGRIGRSNFSVGNFVGPQSGTLATIVSQDPMYVTFPVTQRQLLAVRKEGEAGGQHRASHGTTAAQRQHRRHGQAEPPHRRRVEALLQHARHIIHAVRQLEPSARRRLGDELLLGPQQPGLAQADEQPGELRHREAMRRRQWRDVGGVLDDGRAHASS